MASTERLAVCKLHTEMQHMQPVHDSTSQLGHPHSLALSTLSLPRASASRFAHSRITLRWILPLANLGTSSTKMTPPVSRLCLATRVSIQLWISSGVTLPLEASWMATYARGFSSPFLRCVSTVSSQWASQDSSPVGHDSQCDAHGSGIGNMLVLEEGGLQFRRRHLQGVDLDEFLRSCQCDVA